MIRFIVETWTSRRDVNGNCYDISRVTSTKTGRALRFVAEDHTSAYEQVRQVIGVVAWGVYLVHHRDVPIRAWTKLRKTVSQWQHDVPNARIQQLEEEEVEEQT